MGHLDSCTKQVRNMNPSQLRNSRIVSLLAAASVVSVLIYCFSQLFSGEETAENPWLKLNSSFLPSPKAVDSSAPSVSPLQNTSETVNYGDTKNISSEIRHGYNSSAVLETGNSLDQNHDGGNSISEKGQLVAYERNPEKSVNQSENISQFGVDQEIDRKANVYSVGENEQTPAQCDIYSGKWVHDDSYPLYPAGECSYVSVSFNCKGNGRPDSGYTNWRWQPRDCNLPRLNATDLLERLRGKRLMFIGDSLNRNQWESLLCILRTVVPENRKTFGMKGASTAFVAQDYNCSVEFFWAPFLVELGNMNVGNESKEILRLEAIEKHGANWKDVDILVFNSGHWWGHGDDAALRNYYQEGDYLHPQLDTLVAYEKGLRTWAKWIDYNINPTKTKVFFRGFSPMHFSAQQWNKSDSYKCKFQTEPIVSESFVRPDPEIMQVVGNVLGNMKFPVSLLNITRLSDFRKDGHPSVYKKDIMEEERKDPNKIGDCSHWCLPGLPDIWNELLYGILVMEGATSP